MKKIFDGYTLVSDMDGTLINSNKEISKENLDAIKYFVNNGGKFTVATGRMVASVECFLDRLNLDLPAILHNGGKIYDYNNKKVVYEHFIEEDSDKILGLNVGADDYMTKPFNNMELVARVKSQLRRYDKPLNIGGDGIIKVRDLVIDEVAKKVIVRGVDVKATATEYKILHLLASNLGKTFSIKEIYEKVWEENFYKSENTVTVHIRRIREKIEINTKEPEYIKVVWGIGYKIEK